MAEVICKECSRSYETTDQLLESGKAKCPWCGSSYEVVAEFNWERFQHLCDLDPKEIPPAVREAIWDLKNSLDTVRRLVDEPVDMMMELLAEIQALRILAERWQDSWGTLELYIEARQTPINKEQLQERMKELKERLADE